MKTNNLNLKYTFDNFIVGNSNKFAHAVAIEISKEPGKAYNPFFLFSNDGLGKTHLIQAIGNRILEDNHSSNVLYVTSEKFTNQLINAIKDNKIEIFRNKYRNVDVLLIDDIQFIAGKERVQEEFFHTFNTLYENRKQIVISSDKPPRAIHLLSKKLSKILKYKDLGNREDHFAWFYILLLFLFAQNFDFVQCFIFPQSNKKSYILAPPFTTYSDMKYFKHIFSTLLLQ